jgi:hypothetical protein
MAGELGAGPALDQSMDFSITPDGDIAASRGEEELNKDLAFQLIIILDDLSGQQLSPDTRGQIKSLTVDTINSDTRVESVSRGSVQVESAGRDSIRLSASFISNSGQQEFVITV